MRFSPRQYDSVRRNYNRLSFALDDALYQVCRRYPNHRSRAGVHAKLWLIGRGYATGIERKIKSAGTQGSSMGQLDQHFWRNRRRIDQAIRMLRSVKEPLTLKKLAKILDAHGKMIRIVQPALRKGQTPRSFVAKYLHFHRPAVPVYDSFAQKELRKLYPWKRSYALFHINDSTDEEYAKFVFRFWQLYSDARAAGARVLVKRLDNYLLALARQKQ